MTLPSRLLAPCLLASLLLFGCDRSPNDLRQWQASDHKAASGNAWQVGQMPKPAGSGEASKEPHEASSLVDVVWQSQCVLCHGPSGRGDGPQGPMLRTTNLTLESWQEETSDEQIAEAIVEGKGRMPKFEGLPPEVVSALVAHIRKLRSPHE